MQKSSDELGKCAGKNSSKGAVKCVCKKSSQELGKCEMQERKQGTMQEFMLEKYLGTRKGSM